MGGVSDDNRVDYTSDVISALRLELRVDVRGEEV